MDPVITGLYHTLQRGFAHSNLFEKHAAEGDEVLAAKALNDLALFEAVKEAAINWGAARELAGKAMQHPVGKGLAYGTGAAIPAAAAGSYLIGRAGDEARQTTEDVRNKALQTALGVGAVGAGLYGLHRLTQPSQEAAPKQASAETDEILLEKLSTVGFLDTLFVEQEKHGADESVRHEALECRMLNAEHGIDLLKQLLNE
jgi:hypothetical protein